MCIADVLSDEPEPMNWWWLCMPRLPWSEPSKPPPFYGVNTKIPLSVAMVMGFQHALAMIGGIIAVPLLLTGPYNARLTSAETEYLISAGLLSSGILSLISVTSTTSNNSNGDHCAR